MIMMPYEIEKLSVKLVDSYTVDRIEAKRIGNLLIQNLLYDDLLGNNPWIYHKYDNPYIVFKSVMYALDMTDKSNRQYEDTVMLAYYLLLQVINRQDNSEREIAAASGIGCILVYDNIDFIGGTIVVPLCSPSSAARKIILQIGALYWNYRYAKVHVVLDSQYEERIRRIASSFKPLQTVPPEEMRQDAIKSFYKDIPEILEYIKDICFC